MEQLTLKKKLQVVYLYFSGLSFGKIVAKTGISNGSVVNIITELKAGNFPEAADLTDQIEILRELAVNLAKLKLPAGQSAVGIAVLKRIYELGLDPSDMERWPLLLNSIKTQDDAQELVQVAYTVRDIQQESGLSLPALEDNVKQLGEKVKELETLTAKITKAKNEINDLIKKREDLTKEVLSLEEKYKWLIPRVQELEQREKLLLNRHESMLIDAEKAKEILGTLKTEMKKLIKTGLSLKAMVDFNRKLETVAKHHGIKPSMVRERLLAELKHLDKGLGLETIIEGRQQQLKEIDKAIAKSKSEMGNLQVAVANIQQEKTNLEVSIKATRDGVSQEIAKIIPIATGTVKQLLQELQLGHTEVLAEVRQIRDESIEVGKEVGQYQAILEANQWLNELRAMIRCEENVEVHRVRVIVLSVVRGMADWLKHQNAGSTVIMSVSLATEKFISELEKWQA
jgi:hypothetical protein